MKARQASGLNVGLYGLCLAVVLACGLITAATAGDVTTDNLTVFRNATVCEKLSLEQMPISLPTEGLILHYRLDTNSTAVVDSSGNGVTGTVLNAATWTSAGFRNGAFQFDGYNDMIESPARISPWVSNKVSISLWAKYSATGGTRILFSISATVDNSGSKYWIESGGWNDSGIRFGVQGVGTGVGSGVTPVLGQWYHIVATYDGATMAIYINGALSGSATLVYTQTATAAIRIGFDTGQSYFSGTLDEICVYNRALSSSEVMGMYNNYRGLVSGVSPSLTVQGSILQSSGSATNSFLGRLGIGTNAPQAALHVVGGALFDTVTLANAGTGSLAIVNYNLLTNYVQSGAGLVLINGSTPMTGNLQMSNRWVSGDGGNEGVYVATNGRVGIGTNVPAALLHVAGSARIDGAQTNYGGLAMKSGNIALLANWLSGDGGNEGLYVTDTGKVGVNTVTPQANLHVNGDVVFQQGVRFVAPVGDLSMGTFTNTP